MQKVELKQLSVLFIKFKKIYGPDLINLLLASNIDMLISVKAVTSCVGHVHSSRLFLLYWTLIGQSLFGLSSVNLVWILARWPCPIADNIKTIWQIQLHCKARNVVQI